MGKLKRFCKSAVAAYFIATGAALAQDQQPPDLDALMAELADPDTGNWEQVERRIRLEWDKSGSAAMDLLLQRGREAMEAEDWDAALDHFTALTDHAPDFAEGWHSRATVYFYKDMYGPALDDIAHALSINPQHFGALSGLAVILESIGMEEEALDVWHMLVDIHPHLPQAQESLDRLEKLYGGQPI
ncbi:hypothetical protein [Pseudoruegeria sp. HB172150]|uniref:hypothetical protein n=1 Tax=Pseudoruegeria sp. HB172150 TaxID=2721164 RepID=UPI0020A62E58|nr:hypothetical protein [Pseudoruegeria sp. HB172150]